MGFNGPRKLKVTTPSPKHFEDPDIFKLSEEQSILNFKPPVIAYLFNLNILVNFVIKLQNGMIN